MDPAAVAAAADLLKSKTKFEQCPILDDGGIHRAALLCLGHHHRNGHRQCNAVTILECLR